MPVHTVPCITIASLDGSYLSPPICSFTTVTKGMPFTKILKNINIPSKNNDEESFEINTHR